MLNSTSVNTSVTTPAVNAGGSPGTLSSIQQLQLVAADQYEVSSLRHEIVWEDYERPEFSRTSELAY